MEAIQEQPGLEVEQLLKRVSARVQALPGGAQIPYRSSSLTGDFFFQPGSPEGAATQARVTSAAIAPAAAADLAERLLSGAEAQRALTKDGLESCRIVLYAG